MSESLVVNEIYVSLQGESTFAGLPCIFIRLTACNLRCSYCDTAYAFKEGARQSFDEIFAKVGTLSVPYEALTIRALNLERLPLIEVTGGEPLLQPGSLPLMKRLCDRGYTVLVETSGALDISGVDRRVRKIMDLKCPSSGEVEQNRWENLSHLQPADEIKFVIGTREDYQWAQTVIRERQLQDVCPLLFSWVQPLAPEQQHPSLKPVPQGLSPITRQELAEAVIADALPVRFQVQLHKILWSPQQRGV